MEITNHLSDAEMAEAILDPALRNAHATGCILCQEEILRLRKVAVNYRRSVSLAEEKPTEFWQHQQKAISKRIGVTETKSRRMFSVLAWSSAAAALMAIVLFVHEGKAPIHSQADKDPDHELLLHVEHTMASDGPEALEPAGLLVQEISENSSAATDFSSQDRTHKEKRANEN
jgi:hypothetical protein